MTHLSGIIERLERASGPDTALDLEIARLQGVVVLQYNSDTGFNEEATYHRYTGSLDSALTLVPPNTYYVLGYGKTREPEPLGACAFFKPGEDEPFVQAEAPTIALALCLTALRARSHKET